MTFIQVNDLCIAHLPSPNQLFPLPCLVFFPFGCLTKVTYRSTGTLPVTRPLEKMPLSSNNL